MADAIGVEDGIVEDQVVSDDRFELMDTFFEPNGSKKLMFYYQVIGWSKNTLLVCCEWLSLAVNSEDH